MMLQRLIIEQFVIIDQLELEFAAGLNVLTGETGAGKSIILQALRAVLGDRVNAEMIRAGSEKAVVAALFTADGLLQQKLLQQHGIEKEEDGTLLLQREIWRGSRNVCRINNRIVSLSAFKEIGGGLVNFHSQNEQQTLFAPAKQLAVVDCLGDEVFRQQCEQIEELYLDLLRCNRQLKKTEEANRSSWQRRELLQYQTEEISAASLQPDEELQLETEQKQLSNVEKINDLSLQVYKLLYEGSESQSSVRDLLDTVSRKLQELQRYDNSGSNWLDRVEDCLYQLEDVALDVEAHQNGLEYDELRLEVIEDRLQLIKKLKAKYQVDTIAALLAYQQTADAELAAWQQAQDNNIQLQQYRQQKIAEYKKLAGELHQKRQVLVSQLHARLLDELRQLDIKEASFQIVQQEGVAAATGLDRVAFLISFNKGEPLKPIEKVASGGEMSRFMLSVKTILTAVEQYGTMIFDEIDTGVGGNALQTVVNKLRLLSQDKQVICITHAPQIAATADNHIFVYKKSTTERTVSQARVLNVQEREQEIARMLDGDLATGLSVQHARQMMHTSRSF